MPIQSIWVWRFNYISIEVLN